MAQQQLENTIQFLLDNQAKFHSDFELMKEAQQEITAQIKILTENTNAQIQALTENVEAMRLEPREAFNNLIIANEATRNLASQMGKLNFQPSDS
jgi:phosphatidylserine/phosphatidylglycerophosphate/cardiolipin synthase-like enzyme